MVQCALTHGCPQAQVVAFLFAYTAEWSLDKVERLRVLYDDGCHLRAFMRMRWSRLQRAVRVLFVCVNVVHVHVHEHKHVRVCACLSVCVGV